MKTICDENVPATWKSQIDSYSFGKRWDDWRLLSTIAYMEQNRRHETIRASLSPSFFLRSSLHAWPLCLCSLAMRDNICPHPVYFLFVSAFCFVLEKQFPCLVIGWWSGMLLLCKKALVCFKCWCGKLHCLFILVWFSFGGWMDVAWIIVKSCGLVL